MKKLKWLSLILLVISIAYFAVYNIQAWRTKDDRGPEITMETEEILVSVTDGEEALLEGITAMDAKDGDVTGSVVIESISDFVDANTRYVNYAAFDSDHHVSKASRKVIYTDYTPIRFSMDAPLRFSVTSSGTKELLDGVHAQDCLDGDVSDNVLFSADSVINVNAAGDYAAKLMVQNSAGDEMVLPVTVTIYNTAEESVLPAVQLSQYLVYTPKGSEIDPMSYIVHEEDDQDSYSVIGSVDYNTPGVYEIQCIREDSMGHIGRVDLIVVVEEA